MRLELLDRTHRLYLMLVAIAVTLMMLDSSMAILTEPNSWRAKVAGLTLYGQALGWSFMTSAALISPLIICFTNERCRTRRVLKLATLGAGAGGITSMCLSYISRNIDISWFSLYHAIVGLFCLTAAGVFALILNSEMKSRCAAI
jgi:hypothetical protein